MFKKGLVLLHEFHVTLHVV